MLSLHEALCVCSIASHYYITELRLWVSYLVNPQETSLLQLGAPRGLKGVWHMLSAIVFPTTVV